MVSSIQRGLVYLFAFSLVFEGWHLLNLAGISIPKIIAYFLVFSSLFSISQTFSVYSLKRYLIPLFAFCGFLVASYLVNYEIGDNTFYLVFRILQNAIFFWIVSNIMNNNPQMVFKVLSSLNLGVLLSAILFMLNIGTEIEEGRITLFGENPNRVGLFSVFSILFIISIVFENKQNYGSSRYWLLLLILPLLNMAAGTGSRTTFLGLFMVLSLYFILKSKSKFSVKLFSLIFGAAVMYALYSYFMSFDVMSKRMASFYTEGDIAGRDRIWEFIIPKILKRPILGVGINRYTDIISVLYGQFFSPHNVLIELLAYSGFLGLFSFLIFIYHIAIEGYYLMKINNYVLPILYISMILFVFLSGQGIEVKLFWIIYAYLVTCRINQKKEAILIL